MRTRKTLEERREEAEAVLANLQAKELREEQKDTPEALEALEAVKVFEKVLIEAKRNLSNGPQSLAVSQRKHELWLVEIAAKKVYFEAVEAIYAEAVDEVKALYRESLTTGTGYEAIHDFTVSLDENASEAFTAYLKAQGERKAFSILSKKGLTAEGETTLEA